MLLCCCTHTLPLARLLTSLPFPSLAQPPTRPWFKRQPPLCPTLLFVSLLGRRLKRLAWEAFGGKPTFPPDIHCLKCVTMGVSLVTACFFAVLYRVGKGSTHLPALVVLDYTPVRPTLLPCVLCCVGSSTLVATCC